MGTGGIPAQRDPLDDELSGLNGAAAVSRLVEHLTGQVAGVSMAWVGELAHRSERVGLTIPDLRTAATDLAWQAREAGQRYPDASDWDAIPATDRRHRLVLAYVIGQRLRFDFKFETLQSSTTRWLEEFSDDSLILALAAFAALGLRTGRGLDLFRQAIAAPDADAKTWHACLHGMWFADNLPDQPQLLLDLSSQMLGRGIIDANLFYRRAYALRKLRRYDQALEEVDRAIAMLGTGNNRVHQDYVRERELITVSVQMREYADSLTREVADRVTEQADRRITEASAALTEKVEAAQRVVSDGTLKVVEILGLFVTLAGFLIGSGAVAFKASTAGERVLSMLIVLAGSLMFFVLLRLVTTFRRRP